ncbi:bedwarfed [Lycorma delicatula]|uniref:bedwarfed n=1 Tax=Lycorma delicatula TaxID=130591 RepID=UPI003F50EB2C
MDSFVFSSDSNSSFIIKESTTDTNRGNIEGDDDDDVSITLLSNDELSRVENEVVIIDTHRASVNNVTIDHNYETNNYVLPDVFVVPIKKDLEDDNSNELVKCDVKTPLSVEDNTNIVLIDNISHNYVGEQLKGSSSGEIVDVKLNRSNIGLSDVQNSSNNYLNEVIEIKDEPSDIVLNDDEEISASEFTDFVQEDIGETERKEKQDEKKSNEKFYAIDFCDVSIQEKSKPKSFQSLSITGVKKIEITKNKPNFLVNYTQNSDFFFHNNPGIQFTSTKNMKNDNCLMSFNRKNIWKYFTNLPLSKVKCNLCLKIFFYYNRTSYLLRHLHIKHKNYFSLNNKKFKKSFNKLAHDTNIKPFKMLRKRKGSYEKISKKLQKYFTEFSGRMKCNICFKLFFSTHNINSILRNHIMSKHKNLYSQTSVYITPTEISVDDTHGVRIKSELNENQSVRSSSETNKIKKISLIWEYFTKLNRGKVKCNLCCTLFSYTRSSVFDLRQHLILKHNDVYDNIIKTINNEYVEYNKIKTSKTWQYFTKLDYNEVKCNICLQVFTYHNNTSNLLRHLRFKHGIIFGNFKQNDSNNTSGNSFNSRDSSEMICKKFGEIRSSRTWKYFTKICLDKVRCNICYKILSYVGGISSNLTRHLNTLHGNMYKENNVKIETGGSHNQRDKRLKIKCDKVQKINLTWKYFTKVRPNKAKCNLCPHINILSYSKNCVISNLTRHLERKHKTVIESGCIKSMEDEDNNSLQPSGYNYINSDDSIKINVKFLFNCLKQNEKLKSSIKLESGNIKCSVCSKIFLCTSLKDYEYSLVQHIQIYHAKWEVMCTSNSIIEYQNNASIASNYNELEAIANEIQLYIKEESVHNKSNSQEKIDNNHFENKTYDNVWKYFTRITSENVRCNYCFILLSYRKNKKWNLYRHLKLKHKAKFYESNSSENKSYSIKSKSKFNENDYLLENKMHNYKRKTKFNGNDSLPENKNPNVKKKAKYNEGNENDSLGNNKNYSIKNKLDSSPKVKILPISQGTSGKSKNNVTSNKIDKSKENKQTPVTPLGNRKIGRTWSYFTKIEMGMADCNICHDILSYSGNGTDILNNHLNKKHKDYFSKCNATNIDESNLEIKEQQSVKNKVKYNSNASVRDGIESDTDDDFNKKGNVTPESNDKKKRNKVWTYYTESGNSHAKCHLCLSQISYKGSVDNLTHHLQRIHSVISLPDLVPKTDDVEEEKSQLFAAIDLTPNPSPESKSKTQVCFTKISKNIAKCSFCLKIIPYKNSNIQKLMSHLHNMHLADLINYNNLLFRNSSNFIDISEFRSLSIGEQKSQNMSLTSQIDSGQKSDVLSPKRRRSDTWLYYTKLNNHYAKCNICNNYLSYKGGSIYNLTRHLFIKHNIKFVKRLSKSLYNSKKTKPKTFNKIPKMFNIYKKKSETLSFYKKINRYLVKCKLCSKPFTYKGVNINRLINHLWSVHITKLIGFDESQNQNLLNIDNDDPNEDNYKEVNISGVMSNDGCVNDIDHSHDFLRQGETTYNKETGRKISNAWKYFTKSTDSKAKCNICLKFLSFKSGNISNLSRHLERNHEIKLFKNKSGVIKSKNVNKKINFNDETKSLNVNVNIKKNEVLNDVPVTVLCGQEKNKQKIKNNYIWKYFININDEKVKCKICHENISYEGKVSSLCDHVSLIHKIKIPHDCILSMVQNITSDESVNINSLNDIKVLGSLLNNTDKIIIKRKKLMSHVIKMKCKLCYKYFVSKRRESDKLFEHLKIHEHQLMDNDYLLLKQFFNTKNNLTNRNAEGNSNSFNMIESVGSKEEVVSINETFIKKKLILKYFKNLNSFKNKCKICYRYISDKIHCYHHINNDLLIKYGVKRSKSLIGIDTSSVKIKNSIDGSVEMSLKDKKLKTLKNLKMKHFVNVNLSMPSKCLCNILTQNNGYCSHTLKRWLNENDDEVNLKGIKSFDNNKEPIPSKDEIELLTNSLDEYNENKIIIITDNNDTSVLQCSDINRSEEITNDISYHIMNAGNEIDDDIKVIIYNFNSEEIVESSSQITSGGNAGEVEEISQTSNENQSSNRTLDEHIKVLLKEINNSTKISSSNLSKDSLKVAEKPCNLGEEISSHQSESLNKDEDICVEGSSSKKCDSSMVQEQKLSNSLKIPINQLSENSEEDPNNLDKTVEKLINLSGNQDSVQPVKNNDLNSVELVVEKPGSDLDKTGKNIDNCIKIFTNNDTIQNNIEITDEVLVSNTSSDESKALIKDEKPVNCVISSNDLIDVIFDNVVVTLEESLDKNLNFLNCLSDNFDLKSGKYLQKLCGLHKINKNLIFFSSIDYEYNTAKCNICDDYLIFKTPVIYHLMTHLYLKHKDSLLKENLVKDITDNNIVKDFNSFTCENDNVASRATVTVATVPSRPRKKSPVWKYFINDKNYRATCRVCNFNFSYKGGAVNNLARHLRLRHGIIVSSRNEKGESIENNDDVEQFLMNFPIIPKRRTSVKLRSKTWFYFTKEPNDWARCNICKKYLSYRSSTINNLTRHLRTVHPNAFNSLFTNKGCSTMNDYNNCKEEENGMPELNDDVYNAILSEVSTRSRDEILQECSYASDRSNSKRKSVVWNYFTELSRNSGKCNFCSKIISCKGGGTSNLSRHLRVKHGVWIVMTSSLSQSFHEMQQSVTNDEIVDNDETNFIRDDNRGSLEINSDNDKIITHEHLHILKTRKLTAPNKKSKIWNYFTKENEDRVICNLCSKPLSYKCRAVHNLRRHLTIKHPTYVVKPEPVRLKLQINPESDEFNTAGQDGSIDESKRFIDITDTSVVIVDEENPVPPRRPDRSTRPKKSIVWNYFEEVEYGIAKCFMCSKVLSFRGGGTNNLMRHLRCRHSIIIVNQPNSDLQSNGDTADSVVDTVDSIDNDDNVKNNPNYTEQVS